jgi:hypothetical protein
MKNQQLTSIKLFIFTLLLTGICSIKTSNGQNSKTETQSPGILPKEACGVWCWYSWGATPNAWNGKTEPNETYSKMRGVPIVVCWNELEPQEGIVNWD